MFLLSLILTVSSALSRSDKKVLHVDRNSYYGGAEAAFSLQEAEDWAKKVNQGMCCLHSYSIYRIQGR